ncbi:MAG: hypothetical protein PHQ23_11970 [Candidatus Wallbacteria bacterium]|nr:hypothetical protein [Candidatus Wallbacteria bacterium]
MADFRLLWLFFFIACLVPLRASTFFALENQTLIPVSPVDFYALTELTGRREKLILSSGVRLSENQGAVWIIPAPGTPIESKAQPIPNMPVLFHREITGMSARLLSACLLPFKASQIYPLLPESILLFRTIHDPGIMFQAPSSKIEEHKFMRYEYVVFENTDTLFRFFRQRNISFSATDLRSLESHFTVEEVLHVFWLPSCTELSRRGVSLPDQSGEQIRRPCVQIDFPSDAPYVPLNPAAVNGSFHARAVIYASGFWNYAGSRHASAYLYLKRDESARKMTGGEPYTRFDIQLEPGVPGYTKLSKAVEQNLSHALSLIRLTERAWFIPLYVVLFLSLSWFCAGVSGMLSCGRFHDCASLGLYNIFTIATVLVATRRKRRKFPELFAPHPFALLYWRSFCAMVFIPVFLSIAFRSDTNALSGSSWILLASFAVIPFILSSFPAAERLLIRPAVAVLFFSAALSWIFSVQSVLPAAYLSLGYLTLAFMRHSGFVIKFSMLFTLTCYLSQMAVNRFLV